MNRFFEVVVTSEISNSLKPQKEIFEYALAKTGATVTESIMIGDTIDVDIVGALNAGIDQVHVNHITKEPVSFSKNRVATYTVYNLKELEQIF